MSSQVLPNELIDQLKSSQEFFNRSTRPLEESDSTFKPADGMMTVAQQVGHAAQSLDWFLGGASNPEGFDLDFEKAAQVIDSITSLTEARKMLDAAYAKAIEFLGHQTPETLAAPLPAGPVMGGEPAYNIFWGIIDHTAHHRGALTVYTRLLNKVPVMPYAG
jgi:uncharacterized damage-inducible protein DinB